MGRSGCGRVAWLPRARTQDMVDGPHLGRSDAELVESQAMATAPTAWIRNEAGWARTSSTARSSSSGVLRACVLGARERSLAQRQQQVHSAPPICAPSDRVRPRSAATLPGGLLPTHAGYGLTAHLRLGASNRHSSASTSVCEEGCSGREQSEPEGCAARNRAIHRNDVMLCTAGKNVVIAIT